MERIIKRVRGVGNDALNVEVSRSDEIDSRNIVNGLAILVNEEIESNAVLTEILHVNQRR